MTGKQKCKILKQIRKQIADANEIEYMIEECSHKGKCRGTCPRCEWEVRQLEKALENRRRSGKKVALAGISAGFLLTSCSPIEKIGELFGRTPEPLEGDVPYEESTEGLIAETDGAPVKGEIVEESLAGEPVLEETETELPIPGEAVDTEVFEGLLTVPEHETEEEPTVAGMIPLYTETEEEETEVFALEGDPVYFDPDAEETEDGDEDSLDAYLLEGDVAYIEPEEDAP